MMGSGNRPTIVIDGVEYVAHRVLSIDTASGGLKIRCIPAEELVAHSWDEAVEYGWLEPA